MAEPTITSVLLPLATEDDARQTAASLRQHLPADTTIHAVHVIEHTKGGIDPASPTQFEKEAQQMFATLEELLSEAPYELRSEIRYGTNLVRTLIDVSDEFDVSHIISHGPQNR